MALNILDQGQEWKKHLFNATINTFYIWLYGIEHLRPGKGVKEAFI